MRWYKHPEWPYEATRCGQVRRSGRWITSKNRYGEYRKLLEPRPMSIQVDRYGYAYFRAKQNGRSKTFKVHRFVCEIFLGPGDSLQVNHKDMDKLNNHIDNLEWVTNAENHQHLVKNGAHTVDLYRDPETGRVRGHGTG